MPKDKKTLPPKKTYEMTVVLTVEVEGDKVPDHLMIDTDAISVLNENGEFVANPAEYETTNVEVVETP
jgi:hypothetical protein